MGRKRKRRVRTKRPLKQRTPCRCRNCRRRKVLNYRPESYIRQPQCPSCGKRNWHIDKYRKKDKSRTPCPDFGPLGRCAGYAFPHRKGSKFCIHAKTPPTEEEIRRHLNQWE